VAEAVGGGAELDRHERIPVRQPIEAAAASQDIVDHVPAALLGLP
jgi:hypothetical protein